MTTEELDDLERKVKSAKSCLESVNYIEEKMVAIGSLPEDDAGVVSICH